MLSPLSVRRPDTLLSAVRAYSILGSGRVPPPTSLALEETDSVSSSRSFHNGVSTKIADRAASLAAVEEYCRAMEALSSTPGTSCRGVHEEYSRLHPQDDDDFADVLPDPLSLPRTKLRASEVDIMEVVARCRRKSSPYVDGWRFVTFRALGPPCTLTGRAEAIVNAEVPLRAASFFALATVIPLDKLDPK
jgi:hypothetical protein